MVKVSFICVTEGCPNKGAEGSIEIENGFNPDIICVCGNQIGKVQNG